MWYRLPPVLSGILWISERSVSCARGWLASEDRRVLRDAKLQQAAAFSYALTTGRFHGGDTLTARPPNIVDCGQRAGR